MQKNADLKSMTSTQHELQALYHQEVLEAAKNPQRFGRLDNFTHKAIGLNPLCGDKIELELKVEQKRIAQYRFQATGCALCVASGSVLGSMVESKSVDHASHQVQEALQAFANNEPAALPDDMQLFNHVHQFPSRNKCASLAPRALLAALTGENSPVSCE